MSKFAIIALVAIVVLAGGLVFWFTGQNTPAYNQPATQPQGEGPAQTNSASPEPSAQPPAPSPAETAPAPAPSPAPAPAPATPTTQSFTINANDSSADLITINVSKGNIVEITFNVESEGTYHGGLDFRSAVVSTGAISPGNSKTISFTAASSFSFVPYWPSTNIQKPYNINVVVR